MVCIITCFSHFGAVHMKRRCEERRWEAELMPVPRALSSSCGICVRFRGDDICPTHQIPEDVEQIVVVHENGGTEEYECLYKAEGT